MNGNDRSERDRIDWNDLMRTATTALVFGLFSAAGGALFHRAGRLSGYPDTRNVVPLKQRQG